MNSNVSILIDIGFSRVFLQLSIFFGSITFVNVAYNQVITYATFSLSLLQSSSNNWFEGGEQNFLAMKAQIKLQEQKTFRKFRSNFIGTLNLGVQQYNGVSEISKYRVTDNELFGELLIGYSLGWQLDPYISANLRTPITESFQYTPSQRIRSSNLWDPVTTQESMGFTYGIGSTINFTVLRLGVALKQTRAHNHKQLTDDYKTVSIKEGYKAESGIEFIAEAGFLLDSSISYTGRLDLFGTFKDLNIWTVRSKNEFQIKVWKFIALLAGIYVTHDIKQSFRTQFRQTFSLGIVQSF